MEHSRNGMSLEWLGSKLQEKPKDEVTKRGLEWQAKEYGLHLEDKHREWTGSPLSHVENHLSNHMVEKQ